MVVLSLLSIISLIAISHSQPNGYTWTQTEIFDNVLIRSKYDGDCYLAMGNAVNPGSEGHSLATGEINVFFDCEQGGHYWNYQNGPTTNPNCPACQGWFFYCGSYWSNSGWSGAQLQWDYNLGEGYRIGNNDVNIKVDTATYAAASRDQFFLDSTLSTVWMYNDYNYAGGRWCALQHRISANKDFYNKWVYDGGTTVVKGYEAKFSCVTGVVPQEIEIRYTYPDPTSSPTPVITPNPTTPNPTTPSPTTYAPTTSNPTTSDPTTFEPTTFQPTTSNPTTNIPTTANPTTSEPTTDEPTAFFPTTFRPTTFQPTTAKPTASNPTMSISTTSSPTIYDPVTNEPTYRPTFRPTFPTPTTSAQRDFVCRDDKLAHVLISFNYTLQSPVSDPQNHIFNATQVLLAETTECDISKQNITNIQVYGSDLQIAIVDIKLCTSCSNFTLKQTLYESVPNITDEILIVKPATTEIEVDIIKSTMPDTTLYDGQVEEETTKIYQNTIGPSNKNRSSSDSAFTAMAIAVSSVILICICFICVYITYKVKKEKKERKDTLEAVGSIQLQNNTNSLQKPKMNRVLTNSSQPFTIPMRDNPSTPGGSFMLGEDLNIDGEDELDDIDNTGTGSSQFNKGTVSSNVHGVTAGGDGGVFADDNEDFIIDGDDDIDTAGDTGGDTGDTGNSGQITGESDEIEQDDEKYQSYASDDKVLQQGGFTNYGQPQNQRVPSILRPVSVMTDPNQVSLSRQVSAMTDVNGMDAVYEWLCINVGLPQYLNVFTEHGYVSLDLIKEIVDRKDLKEIGIQLHAHQTKIIAEIRKLRRFNVKANDMIPHNVVELQYGNERPRFNGDANEIIAHNVVDLQYGRERGQTKQDQSDVDNKMNALPMSFSATEGVLDGDDNEEVLEGNDDLNFLGSIDRMYDNEQTLK